MGLNQELDFKKAQVESLEKRVVELQQKLALETRLKEQEMQLKQQVDQQLKILKVTTDALVASARDFERNNQLQFIRNLFEIIQNQAQTLKTAETAANDFSK